MPIIIVQANQSERDADRVERHRERAAALWLYTWSYEALRPTGELLAARLTTPAVLRPGKRVGRLSPHRQRQLTSRNAS
jgi:non-ribosomal peptide synthetase component F